VFPKRPRLANFDYIGRYRYFLTLCAHERDRPFVTDAAVDLVLTEILSTASNFDFAIPAYVLMPDHAHILAEGCTGTCDLKKFVSLAKQKSAYAYSRSAGKRLWQPSFYDHVLRDDESSLRVLHYIIQNPVRSGLVERCTDYPYLGSATTTVATILAHISEAGAASWEP
jgi:REP-associated tyrosine transposase